MVKYLRKNITLQPTPEGNIAYDFLDKLGHYQGRFLTQLINQYLVSNGIDTAEKLQQLSREDAQIMILSNTYSDIGLSKNSGNANSQMLANDFLSMLSNIVLAGQNANSNQENLKPISSAPVEQLTETLVDSASNYQNNSDIEDVVDDDDLGDIDLSMIEAFRQ